jgi:hypothetical protein
MALPLPALTFEQTAIFTPASNSAADVLTAIEAAFAALSTNQWTTARAKGEDASNPAIRITAPAGSAIAEFNAILGAPAGAGGFTQASYRDYTMTATADDKFGSATMWLAVGPDGFDEGSAPANWYSGANAFGTGKRESGYWTALNGSGGGSSVSKLWVVASAETCAICFRYASDNNCGFMYFGAIVEGVNAANVESDDRLYGMCTPGSNNTQPMDQVWSYQSGLQKDEILGHGNVANWAHAGVFDPASAGAASFPAVVSRRGTSSANAQRILGVETFDGGLAGPPIESWRGRYVGGTTQAPYYAGFCGRLRGTFYTPFGNARSILLDTSAAAQGYRMSGSLSAGTYDAFVFGNEG